MGESEVAQEGVEEGEEQQGVGGSGRKEQAAKAVQAGVLGGEGEEYKGDGNE